MICDVSLLSRSSSGMPDDDARYAVRQGQRLTRIRCGIAAVNAIKVRCGSCTALRAVCEEKRSPTNKQGRNQVLFVCGGSLFLTTPAKGRRTTVRVQPLRVLCASSEPSVLALALCPL